MHLRLLPALMVVAALALVTKVGGLVAGFQAEAQGVALAAEDVKESAVIEAEVPEDRAQTEEMAAAEGEAPVEPTLPSQKSPLPPDPFELTDQEIDLLQALAQRREELDHRSRSLEIDRREALMAAAEIAPRARRSKRAREALKLHHRAACWTSKRRARATNRCAVFGASIYESMKPKEAARILEDLDLSVACWRSSICMKERKFPPRSWRNMDTGPGQDDHRRAGGSRSEPPIPIGINGEQKSNRRAYQLEAQQFTHVLTPEVIGFDLDSSRNSLKPLDRQSRNQQE